MTDINVLKIKETITPTATADYGKFYCKSDNLAYFQDGAGTEHPISDVTNGSTELNVLSTVISAGVNRVITGSIDPTASRHVVGVGTLFTTEINVGDQLVVSGETRTVVSITDNTNLDVNFAFSDNANDTSPEVVPVRCSLSNDVFVGSYYCKFGTIYIDAAIQFTSTNSVIRRNAFNQGGNDYYWSTNPAEKILMTNGTTTFYGAATGTDGAQITWTECFQMTADGSLLAANISTGSGNAVHINATTGELYENTSSQQFKDNITDITLGLDTILKLRPVNFTWNDKTANNGESDIGLIAEEVDLVSKELVIYKKSYSEYNNLDSADKPSIYQWCKEKQEIDEQPVYTESPYGVRYTQLTVVNSKAIQELHALIQSLEQRIATLEGGA